MLWEHSKAQEVGRALTVQHSVGHCGQVTRANHDWMTGLAFISNVKLKIMMSLAVQTISSDSRGLKQVSFGEL